ncbi:YdcF family protein [Pelagicoccus sp. SDUM812003]|uniref:YdcF family protein n=1 Tax=Pelagicoccus sp. SDUM812003 TaxID=3041267 RepID=UPI00280E489E|nr:YdcF family protein [Pelagicoccus sp. SDUM812003]MDQ8202232.1 YdcF family protein [Pelagicoccus sp. SDUM812003]
MFGKNGIIIVLGSPNSPDGVLFSVAKARCEQAYKLWKDNPTWKILLTGGFGEHFNTTPYPHAKYLSDYLVKLGVAPDRFLEFASSRNTIEDASLSRAIVEGQNSKCIVVITSDYHLARARYLFEKEYKTLSLSMLFIGVRTDESLCEFDLPSQIQHEKRSLERLMAQDND